MSLGFTARETIPIVFFGFMICSIVVTLTGKVWFPRLMFQYLGVLANGKGMKMGATYHVAYPVIVRSTFGMIGSYPAIVIRGAHCLESFEDAADILDSFCGYDVDCHSLRTSRCLPTELHRSHLALLQEISQSPP